jgi:ribosomal protein L3 glutamine methyltransferase
LTLRDLIRQTEKRLRAARLHYGHGTDNPRDEAAFLVLRGLGLPFDADLSQRAEPRRVEDLLRRRIEARIPTAYLLREAWLSGVPFYVDRRVIIPRSHIAELLREDLPPWRSGQLRRIVDLCTGSGCLAILAALAFPGARVDAAELSAAALAVARRNVARHRLQSRVTLVKSDLFEGLAGKRYDLILTNPPYVTSAAMRRLPPEYRHEPGLALAAGRDGLDVVRRIVAEASGYLAKDGWLVCEVGDARRAVERAFPRLAFVWPKEEVFMLAAASMASGRRSSPTPPRASR